MSRSDDEEPLDLVNPDPDVYEQECFRAVLLSICDLPVGRGSGLRRFHAVRLEGQHPDTRLVITMSLGAHPPERLEWGLWGNDFGDIPPGGRRASPKHVATDVSIIVDEF